MCSLSACIVALLQSSEIEAETAETESLGRLKKLHKLVQTKKGQQSGGAKGRSTSENNGEFCGKRFCNRTKPLPVVKAFKLKLYIIPAHLQLIWKTTIRC